MRHACERVYEADFLSMETQARRSISGGFMGVKLIAENRMPDAEHMHAELMAAACERREREARGAAGLR